MLSEPLWQLVCLMQKGTISCFASQIDLMEYTAAGRPVIPNPPPQSSFANSLLWDKGLSAIGSIPEMQYFAN